MTMTMNTPWMQYSKQKRIDPALLEYKIQTLRTQNNTIATINGSFDLLHAGHMHILYEASQTADILIVALNSDASIRQYKSPDRPLIPLEYRIQMMSALSFVDFVTWFDETDPIQLLNTIKPDVHVNGSEYGHNCIEKDVVEKHGGHVHIVPLVPGLSTSGIIKRIQLSCV